MYDEILLEHNLHPEFKGEIAGVKPIRLRNASCGDELLVYLKIENDVIVDGHFTGVGCAISQASADLFMKEIRGKTVSEVREMSEVFDKMLVSDLESEEDRVLGEISALAIVKRMPARVKCAKLVWESLEKI